MRCKWTLALLLIFIPLLTGGCWGRTETDEVAYVVAMGFDKGEKNNLIVTVQIANPRPIAGGGQDSAAGNGNGTGHPSTVVRSVEGIAPISSLDILNTPTTRKLSLLHTKAYFFSDELAREGLGRWMTSLNRLREFRETANVYIVRGQAREFIEQNRPQLESNPAKQYELMNIISDVNSIFLPMQFQRFYEESKSVSIQPNLPLVGLHEGGLETAKPGPLQGGPYEIVPYKAGEAPIMGGQRGQFIGNAVFQGDKMVGEMDGSETRAYLLVRGEFRRATINFADPIAGPEYYVAVRIRQQKNPAIHTEITEDGEAKIDVDVYIEGNIVAISSGLEYETPENLSLLEQAINELFETNCRDLIQRSQQEFKADIFGFGFYMKHHFLFTEKWEDFAWLERYPNAQVNLKVHTKIRRTSLQQKTSPYAYSTEGGM